MAHMSPMPHAPNVPPPPPHHFPPGMDPRMQEVNHLFGQMNVDPHHPPHVERVGPASDPRRPSISRIDTVSSGTVYEGFICEKEEPDFPGGKKTWSRIIKTPMVVDQSVLANRAKTQETKGPSATKILNSKEMEGMKKNQVQLMVKEKNETELDSRYVWKPVYINTEEARVAQGKRETILMEVILKRLPRATAETAKRLQPVRGIVIDVNKVPAPRHPTVYQPSPRLEHSVAGPHGARAFYNAPPGHPMVEIAPGPRPGGRPVAYNHPAALPHGVEVMPEGFPSPPFTPMTGSPQFPRAPMPGFQGHAGHGHNGHPPPGNHHPQPGQGHPHPGQGHPHPGQGHPHPGQGHPHPGQGHPHPGHGQPNAVFGDKKAPKHGKPDIHHHPKIHKDTIEDWRHDTGPSLRSSDSDSDSIFDPPSDNDTVLITPNSSINGEDNRRDKRRSSRYEHKRRESHHNRKHSDYRDRRQSSPPPPPRRHPSPSPSPRRQAPFLPEGCVIMPAETFRDTIHGIQRLNSTRYERPVPPRRGDSYRYEGRREPVGRIGGPGLGRRESYAGPRRVLDREYDDRYEERERREFDDPRYYRGERERGGYFDKRDEYNGYDRRRL